MKQIIKDYFNFSRQERIGVIAIILLLVIIFFLPNLVATNKPPAILNADTAWAKSIRKLEVKNNTTDSDKETNSTPYYATDRKTYPENIKANPGIVLFYFNPNTISAEEWERLGIKEKTITNIQNYLAKGGKFRKPEDLQKIYSLSKSDYERLFPFIKIVINSSENPEHYSTKEAKENEGPSRSFKRSAIDINTADTTALIALPGIGSKLALRIINFRDKLGGFYSVDQLKETYGLQDSVFQKIKQYLTADNTIVKKININTVTIDELKTHPYLKYNIAKAIVAYRNEHGPFLNKEDMKKIMAVTDEVYNKIAPYIIIQ